MVLIMSSLLLVLPLCLQFQQDVKRERSVVKEILYLFLCQTQVRKDSFLLSFLLQMWGHICPFVCATLIKKEVKSLEHWVDDVGSEYWSCVLFCWHWLCDYSFPSLSPITTPRTMINTLNLLLPNQICLYQIYIASQKWHVNPNCSRWLSERLKIDTTVLSIVRLYPSINILQPGLRKI